MRFFICVKNDNLKNKTHFYFNDASIKTTVPVIYVKRDGKIILIRISV